MLSILLLAFLRCISGIFGNPVAPPDSEVFRPGDFVQEHAHEETIASLLKCAIMPDPDACLADLRNGDGKSRPEAPGNHVIPVMRRGALPDNINSTFWDEEKPPSTHYDPRNNLVFELLHCDKPYDLEDKRAKGDCHYISGELGQQSEYHLEFVLALCVTAGTMLTTTTGWKVREL